MKRAVPLALAAVMALSACLKDETLSGYGASGVTWTLVELDGVAFTENATLSFPEPGRIAGQAPCNRFFAKQTAPYPWFKAEDIGTTRMTCPAAAAETAYLEALSSMTLSEVAGDVLLLSNDAGREMLFRSGAPAG